MNPAPGKTLCFVTSNAGKLREAEAILPLPVQGVSLELEELQVTALQPLVRHKAAQAFRLLAVPLLVEDTVLVFTAWGELPGPFIKFFLKGLGPAGLVRALEPAGDLSAEALCGVGYHDGWRVHYFQGRVAGRIVPPRGSGGFGWDAIFEPAGSGRTYAELEPEAKNANSMRAQALTKLAEFLTEQGKRTMP